jgi:membrane AbrB-like protein
MGWPLPFIVGAMIGGMASGLFPGNPTVPGWLTSLMAIVIGIMVGSAFSPAIFAGARGWGITLSFVAAYTFATVALGYLLMRYVGGYDPVTAYCMSSPGGFLEMILLGRSMGGDARHIALIHAIRITCVVLVLPWTMPRPPGGVNVLAASAADWPAAKDWMIFAICGLGAMLAVRLRVPGALMVGPLALSALAHMTGLTEAKIPGPVAIVAQIVVGAASGCGVMALNPRALIRTTIFGFAQVALLLSLSAGFALALAWLTARPFANAFLLFAPGSTPEMSLIALTLDIEPAMIATHHLFRLVLIVTTLPLILRWLLARAARRAGKEPPP